MGRINKGILGGFSGKVGTVVGANWRGIDVMRSLPKISNRQPSARQLEVRTRFTLVARFLAPIKSLLSLYFGQPSGEKSRFNLAFSYHNLQAIIGDYPNYDIDYQKVIISKGELLGAQQPEITALSGAELKFNWTDNSGQGEALATDQMLFLVFNPVRRLFAYRTDGATRDQGSFVFGLPGSWTGDTVHSWIAVVNDNGSECSISAYLGSAQLL